MSRWELLRNSLHGKGSSSKQTSQSTHRFDGHNIVARKKVIWLGFTLCIDDITTDWPSIVANYFEQIDCSEFGLSFTVILDECIEDTESGLNQIPDITCTNIALDLCNELRFVVRHQKYQPLYSKCQFIEYRITSSHLPVPLVVRVQDESRKISVRELASDHHFGVDNTGNVCVWESEAILLHLLLLNPKWTNLLLGKLVLEIGGGQTALCGLGIASIASEVILTDGHPHCVRNQQVCIEMCRMQNIFPASTSVRTEVLEWSSWKSSSITPNSIDVVLGSDCLFFRDFHDSLVEMLHGLLCDDGIVIFLQPARSGSMEQFKQKACDLFDIEEHYDYDQEMSQKRDHFIEHEPSYALDIHYPILLILRKKPVITSQMA